MIIISANKYDLRNQIGLFKVTDDKGACLSLETCLVSEIPKIISSYPITCKDTVNISLISFYDSSNEANLERMKLWRSMGSPEMFFRKKTLSVKCIETGEVFKTQYEAAKAHRINQSNLSKVLQNKPGHRTVQGKRYIYVEDDIT